MPKVSIIVAAYNAERYISRCLDSFAAQTLEDWECIVVDDGSMDRTGVIIDEYAALDHRFRVFHQQNGGVASARQIGIDNVCGEYIIHADSDDWVDSTMLEELWKNAQLYNSDMVICDYYEICGDGEHYSVQNPDSSDRTIIWGKLMNTLAGSLCNKLVRRECYTQFHIRFEKDINEEEDKLICLKLLSHDIRVSYLNKAFYHYDHTQNPISLSNSGYSPVPRLRIMKCILDYTDISPVQEYFDNAVFYIAYQAIWLRDDSFFCFKSTFDKFRKNIFRAKGFPFRSKFLIWCRFFHIPLHLPMIKKLLGKR